MSEAPLGSLVGLLRDEPAVMRALGDPSARIAVAEVARPVSIAALARLSKRRPLLVACATGTDAARLHDDLCQLLPMESVALFPAWETLPFERVSPAIETMGRRLEVLWRLRRSDDCPRVIVAGIRALLQRLGPGADAVSALEVAHGGCDRSRRRSSAISWPPAIGARSWLSIAVSSPAAARSSTCSPPLTTGRCGSISGATRSTV